MKRIIWDWNGTLFNDVQLSFNVINRLLERYSLPVLKHLKDYRNVFGFPIENYYRKVGFDLDTLDFSILAKEYMEDYQPKSKDCTLYADAIQALELARDEGYSQCILSASETKNLMEQIKRENILHFFDGIYSTESIEAPSKLDQAISIKKTYPQDTLIVIGDSSHDYQLAQEIQAHCILVNNGHQDISMYPNVCDSLIESVRKTYEID